MIKTISVPGWPETEKRIAALPEVQKQKYEELKFEYGYRGSDPTM